MKNKLNFFVVIILSLVIGLGCGITERIQKQVETDSKSSNNSASSNSSNSSSNSNDKTLTDATVETVVGGQTVGVPECDEAFDYFAKKINNDQTDYVTKIALTVAEKALKESIRQELDKTNADRTSIATVCKEVLKKVKESETQPAK